MSIIRNTLRYNHPQNEGAAAQETDLSDYVRTNFDPQKYAFRFPNRFTNEYDRWWHPRIKTSGRCGGMCYTALDLYYAGQHAPPFTPEDFPGSDVPPDDHPLSDYINLRQWQSALTGRGLLDGLRFVWWSGLKTRTLVRKTDTEEIPKIRLSIDRGVPVVLGLIGTSNFHTPQKNHQVVCYGYRNIPGSQTEFLIYDPNEPAGSSLINGSENALNTDFPSIQKNEYRITLSKRAPESGFPYRSDRPQAEDKNEDRWRGFFVMRHRPANVSELVTNEFPGKSKP